MKSNKFKLVFQNTDNQEIDVDYTLHESILAEKWANKIKHLKNVQIDETEAQTNDVSDLKGIYKKFCELADLVPIEIKALDQPTLNRLHEIFEQHHDTLARKSNNETLYKFHHAIHYHETSTKKTPAIFVGWGVYEGPLTETFDCHRYYAEMLEQNNIYLPWAELGKTPLYYWMTGEPNEQMRFNELCQPHRTFRAKFMVALRDRSPEKFNPSFTEWFNRLKPNWLEKHGIEDYTEMHEYSAPLLAHTEDKTDLEGFKLVKILA